MSNNLEARLLQTSESTVQWCEFFSKAKFSITNQECTGLTWREFLSCCYFNTRLRRYRLHRFSQCVAENPTVALPTIKVHPTRKHPYTDREGETVEGQIMPQNIRLARLELDQM